MQEQPHIMKPTRCTRTIGDLLKEILHCGAAEGSDAQEHLVQDDTHGPPVHRKPCTGET